MSRFSGKCDLYDEFFMINEDEGYRRNSKVYVGCGDDRTPIRNECDKDLVPYFPFVCVCGSGDRNGWNGTYTEKPWFDIEDENYLNGIITDAIKYYKKCKRKKIEFDKESCYREVHGFGDYNEKEISRVIDIVAENGTKAVLPKIPSEIRLTTRDFFRKQLVEEMVKYGYTQEQADEWVYKGNKTW